jgi:hypothetical protein
LAFFGPLAFFRFPFARFADRNACKMNFCQDLPNHIVKWMLRFFTEIYIGLARRLVERFEWHYTPKHGSWLDLAESELGVLTSQCLDRRIADKQTLVEEIAAWEHDRNANHTKANWQFSTPNARIKLKHLYPAI